MRWAESDLSGYMTEAPDNAPMFIVDLYDAGNSIKKHPDFVVPDVPSINHILAKHSVGYELQPPDLISRNLKAIIPVQDRPPSLDDEAHEIIRAIP